MYQDNESSEFSRMPKRRKLSEDLAELAPEVQDIPSLIEIAQRKVEYQNLDSQTLWKILPELKKLNNMIGMEGLKTTMFYQIIYYLQNMHKKGQNEYLHTVITGPPGTGKTSVAEIIGNIYKNMGVLSSKGSFTLAKREDFIAPYLGQTAIKTRVLLESCVGGVLFIDEAYALGPGQKDKDSFSKEAIDTLNAFLSEHKNDFCCIIAGYEEDIEKCFFKVNKGLERRFQWVHRIDKYSDLELAKIMFKMINEVEWKINVSLDALSEFIKKNNKCFKNFGGDIETFLSKCKMAHAQRVFSLEDRHRFIITQEDLDKAIELTLKNNMDGSEPVKPPFGMYL
jgi:SpoVK/Ycf46/Vps4 family AAA+-type ATPase